MPLVSVLLFFLGCLLIYLMVFLFKRKLKKDIERHLLSEDDAITIAKEIVDLFPARFENNSLINVYYSVVGEDAFDQNEMHSIDNAIFFEFEEDTWLSIMYNSVLELYQVDHTNPMQLDLEYELTNMNKHSAWEKMILQEVKEVQISTAKIDRVLYPQEVVLNFKEAEVYICFSKKEKGENHTIHFGIEWLYLIFDKSTFENRRDVILNSGQ